MEDRFILRNVNDGEEHELALTSLKIGRHEDCDIVINKGHPSRRHARFHLKDDRWFVEDLDSTNGTFVNNRRIHRPTAIQPGDVIKFGSEAYYFLSREHTEQTIVAGKLSFDNSIGGSSVVEEEDPAGELTSIQQSFPLPPGWSSPKGPESRHSKAATDKLLEKAFAGRERPAAALIFYRPQRKARVYGLSPGKEKTNKWAIGRRKDCQVRVDDPSISGLHAHLVNADNRWTLTDAESTNGIRYKGLLKSEVTLEDGDSVNLGQVEMVLRVFG